MERFKKMFERVGKPEEVKGAVIRYAGENFVAPNHTLAWDAILEKHGPMAPLAKEEARGFITSRGRIVDEQEAKEIAYGAKQIDIDVLAEDDRPLSTELAKRAAQKKEEAQ